MIEEVRRLGQEVLEGWADGQVANGQTRWNGRRGFGGRAKKLRWHSTFGDIEVDEPQYREGTRRRRPFVQSAQVQHRGLVAIAAGGHGSGGGSAVCTGGGNSKSITASSCRRAPSAK